MEKILEFMGKDHDRLDSIFEKFRHSANDPDELRQRFHDFKIGLQRHIVWEEDILFPVFENNTGMRDSGPTAVMRMEHRKIKEFLEKIHQSIARGIAQGAAAEIDRQAGGLIEVLSDHNNKEEEILYPWIDETLSEKELDEIFAKMKELPADKFNKCCG
ncbi:hemerythrin domain-containing protein [Candidatus Woesearchaeota archaeon]|nr:hemerythrin domain-containing protein [Candidatus Woesearchaeota archaeon]